MQGMLRRKEGDKSITLDPKAAHTPHLVILKEKYINKHL